MKSSTANPLPSTPVPTLLLEHENSLLRSQLKLEELQSANLRLRLNSLEDKFSRLEALITSNNTTVFTAPISVTSPDIAQAIEGFSAVDVTRTEVKREEVSVETNLVEVIEDRTYVARVNSMQRNLSSITTNNQTQAILSPSSPRPTLSQLLSSIQLPSLNLSPIQPLSPIIPLVSLPINSTILLSVRSGVNGRTDSRIQSRRNKLRNSFGRINYSRSNQSKRILLLVRK